MPDDFYYCYDAHCGWCYGFKVISALRSNKSRFHFEVLWRHGPQRIGKADKANGRLYKQRYKRVEETTGVIGADYLRYIQP